jgi:hypothetical protein
VEKIVGKKKIKEGNRKGKREGYCGHFTFVSTLHSQPKLFCQMFLQNGFNFTSTATITTVPKAPLLIARQRRTLFLGVV